MKSNTPKAIADKLRVYAWKEYAGDDPDLLDFWAKDGIAIKVVKLSKIADKYHVVVVKPDHDFSKFVSLTELEALIEKE